MSEHTTITPEEKDVPAMIQVLKANLNNPRKHGGSVWDLHAMFTRSQIAYLIQILEEWLSMQELQ
jgi:hypothetical protein